MTDRTGHEAEVEAALRQIRGIAADHGSGEYERIVLIADAALNAVRSRSPQDEDRAAPRNQVATTRPRPQIVALADRIYATIGHGGANFPGAAELYEAARKIEKWGNLLQDEDHEPGTT
jgi:hypothetical protein